MLDLPYDMKIYMKRLCFLPYALHKILKCGKPKNAHRFQINNLFSKFEVYFASWCECVAGRYLKSPARNRLREAKVSISTS